jgi:anti-sigma B factor antagonist
MIHTTTSPSGIVHVRPGVERLTASNAMAFKDDIVELIDDGKSMFVIDFKDVSFVDSSGLGALVGALKRVGNRGEMSICSLSLEVDHMFRLCRMDKVFQVYRDAATAVQSMSERL